jgi:hypothetical protein
LSHRAARLGTRLGRATGSLAILVAVAAAAQSQSVESIIRDPSAQPAAWFARNCVPLKDVFVDGPDVQRSCSVNEFGALAGVGGTRFSFALYRRLVTIGSEPPQLTLDRAPFRNTAVVIFDAVGDGSRIQPILAHVNKGTLGDSWFERPRIIATAHGLLLMIPDRIGGTAAANEDIYYRWDRSAWRQLETQSWLEELARRLPKGFGVWKGIVPDLQRMKAGSAVWRDGDANCCPTGGSVCVELAYRKDALVIDTVRHDPTDTAGACAD